MLALGGDPATAPLCCPREKVDATLVELEKRVLELREVLRMKADEAALAQSTESALMLIVGACTLLLRMGVAERVPMLAREIHRSLMSRYFATALSLFVRQRSTRS